MQYGTTPLIWAARKGHYDCVMHLLANGADVDQEGAVSTQLDPAGKMLIETPKKKKLIVKGNIFDPK